MRTFGQPVRCTAEHVQAAVDAATTAPDVLAASWATSAWLNGWDVVRQVAPAALGGYLGVSLFAGIMKYSQNKKNAKDIDRLKAEMRSLGYHPQLLARLESMVCLGVLCGSKGQIR
jgi:hypothetical protein